MNLNDTMSLYSDISDTPIVQEIEEIKLDELPVSQSIRKKKSRRHRRNTILRKKNKCTNTSVQSANSIIDDALELNDGQIKENIFKQTIINDLYDESNVSDEILTDLTLKIDDGTENFLYLFEQDIRMRFIRCYISLIHQVYYERLQQSHWKYYFNLGITKHIWNTSTSIYSAEKYAIDYTYSYPKKFIQEHLNQSNQQLQEAEYKLQQFEFSVLSKYTRNNTCFSAMKKLSALFYELVSEKHKSLKQQLENEQKLLNMNVIDHQLYENFFQTEPNKTHLIIASRIWKATKNQLLIEEDIHVLEKRLNCMEFTTISNNLIHHMIDDIDSKIKNYKANDIETLISTKKIIIQQAISTCRKIQQDLDKIIEKERKKFSLNNRFCITKSEWLHKVLDTIEIRQTHMKNRANYIIQYKLSALFATKQ